MRSARSSLLACGALGCACLITSPASAAGDEPLLGAPNGPSPSAQPAPAVTPDVRVGTGIQLSAQDDVAWEERRVPYHGGPVRPGAQIDERINGPLIYGGAAALVVGLVLSGVYMGPRPYAFIPIVGPFLGAANVLGPAPATDANPDGPAAPSVAGLVIAGLLRVGGAAAFASGFFLPRRFLVYDAPVGSPSLAARERRARFAFVPSAPGATFGATLSLVHF